LTSRLEKIHIELYHGKGHHRKKPFQEIYKNAFLPLMFSRFEDHYSPADFGLKNPYVELSRGVILANQFLT